MVTWVLFLGIGLVFGIIAGVYFARLDDVSNSQKKILQQKLDVAEQQLKTYQAQVTEHFLQTASLVNSMTESYKAVHEHLTMGARELCDSEVNVAQLEMPPSKLLSNPALNDVTQNDVPQNDATLNNATGHDVTQTTKATSQADVTENQTNAVSPSDQPEQATENQPEEVAKSNADAEQPQQAAEAIQPSSTPESLPVDEHESGSSKSLNETESATPGNVSRMVH